MADDPFLEAVGGLTSVLNQLDTALDTEGSDNLAADDNAVLLFLGLHIVRKKLSGWIESASDAESEPTDETLDQSA